MDKFILVKSTYKLLEYDKTHIRPFINDKRYEIWIFTAIRRNFISQQKFCETDSMSIIAIYMVVKTIAF